MKKGGKQEAYQNQRATIKKERQEAATLDSEQRANTFIYVYTNDTLPMYFTITQGSVPLL